MNRLEAHVWAWAKYQELLDRNVGDPAEWALPERVRLAAAWFDQHDLEAGRFDLDEMTVQRDLRLAADYLEALTLPARRRRRVRVAVVTSAERTIGLVPNRYNVGTPAETLIGVALYWGRRGLSVVWREPRR